MKKSINFALFYAIAAMAGGVFYREFTKFNDFLGITVLGKVHTHLFLLGMVMFLIAALFQRNKDFTEYKTYKAFPVIYNAGVCLTAIMMLVRGIAQVSGMALSKGADASISGVAGIGHVLIGTGIILFLITLKKEAKSAKSL